MHHRSVIAIALLAVAVPATGQTLFEKLLKQIVKPKPTANGTVAASSGGAFTVGITPAQTAAIDRLLAQPLQDARIATDRADAMPLIRTVLSTASCATADGAWNAVNRFHMTPKTFGSGYNSFYVPMADMRYHDKSRCLDVIRLTDWTKPANNALTFQAYYLAADSGEAKRQTFELQKSSEGQWMIRKIGFSE